VNATVREPEVDRSRRGYEEGLEWANEYAPPELLRALVMKENPDTDDDDDSADWRRGFVAGLMDNTVLRS